LGFILWKSSLLPLRNLIVVVEAFDQFFSHWNFFRIVIGEKEYKFLSLSGNITCDNQYPFVPLSTCLLVISDLFDKPIIA